MGDSESTMGCMKSKNFKMKQENEVIQNQLTETSKSRKTADEVTPKNQSNMKLRFQYFLRKSSQEHVDLLPESENKCHTSYKKENTLKSPEPSIRKSKSLTPKHISADFCHKKYIINYSGKLSKLDTEDEIDLKIDGLSMAINGKEIDIGKGLRMLKLLRII